MISNQVVQRQIIYYQDTTTNQSFMDMHYILRAKGVKNNKFFLAIYDPDLMGVDPRDPSLSKAMKIKILRECQINYWYFIREVVRIPVEGGVVGSGLRYKLHRGNLAMNYCFIHNFDQFVDLPRQHFKTISALVWYLWVFNFGTSNTQMMFINKKHEDSKDNLKKMKNIRESLPDYLRMDALYDRDGKRIRVPNTAETLQNPINKNIIKTLPAARTKAMADGAGRGCTMAIQYYDEFAFMPYNSIIYEAAVPAFSRAKQNAALNRAPYGMLITTTPGDLTTDEGAYANNVRLNATVWHDELYDRSYTELTGLRDANDNSTFFYIRYTHKQLGSGTEYFKEMVRLLQKNWPKIRREVLLEWANGSMNCAFKQEDLDAIKGLCKMEPINSLYFGSVGQYRLNIWEQLPVTNQYPPIIGVDVAGGWQNDSSAITIIDSKTTKVLATLNCNFIPSQDLAQIVYEIVTNYMPNAIVNIERNGGFGGSVLQLLIKSSIRKNLYYEIKEQVKEQRFDGVTIANKKQKVISYGTDNTKDNRIKLIELLHQRVNFHKDKFIAPILHDELSTMEVKKNGKTEHASNAHDDQVFSYLMALYVWYYGENIMERFHIFKTEIKTDADTSETSFDLEDRYGGDFEKLDPNEILIDSNVVSDMVNEQTKVLDQFKTFSIDEFYQKELEKDNKALTNIVQTPYGKQAVISTFNIDQDYLDEQFGRGVDIGEDILLTYYGDNEKKVDAYDGNLASMFRNI